MTDDVDVAELEAWAAGLAQIQARVAPRFARSEPRERVAAYVRGLLAPLKRRCRVQSVQVRADTLARSLLGPHVGCSLCSAWIGIQFPRRT